MRIPKAFIVLNVTLLLAAIASWAWFWRLQMQKRSLPRRSPMIAFFPRDSTGLEIVVDGSGGNAIQPFDLILGRPLTETEAKRPLAMGHFVAAMGFANEVPAASDWTKFGEVRFTTRDNDDVWRASIYKTPEMHLGFEHAGKYFRAAPDSKQTLEFIEESRRQQQEARKPGTDAEEFGRQEKSDG